MCSSSNVNPFVETTLSYVITYLSLPSIPALRITILADNDYYSQPIPNPARFNPLGVRLADAHKTGLGSSAALVTSLTAALAVFLGGADVKSTAWKHKIHNLAQGAHCAAQGKVGSGFDVAAAVFGSCVYHRFSASLLSGLDSTSPDFAEKLRQVVDSKWDYTMERVAAPRGLRLIMADVDCGSATPGMVKSVLKWRSENPEEAKRMWDELEKVNQEIIVKLEDIAKTAQMEGLGLDPDYSVILDNYLTGNPSIKNPLAHLEVLITQQRSLIREMGAASGVPIEPESQTALLDAGTAVHGVIGGCVPGAGGYDAVAFLAVDKPDVLNELAEVLRGWKFGEKGGKVEILEGAREEREGVKEEDVATVLG